MRLPPDTLRRVMIAGCLLAAGFLLAWLRFRPHLGSEAGYTDGRQQLQLDEAALRYAVWEAPVPLGPEVNGVEAESRAAVSPDGTQLVFAVGEAGLNAELWLADLLDGRPVDSRPLATLNSAFDDLAPAFGSDALWFASNRPGGQGGFDLLRAPWRDGVFGAPERLPAGLDSAYDELDPMPVPGSRALVFASNTPRGLRSDFDLVLAVPLEQGWRLDPLTTLNSAFHERGPAYAADGRVLVFASDRDGGQGGFDLLRAIEGAEGWLQPEPLHGVNSAGDELGPTVVAGGFGLLLASSPSPGAPTDLQRARSLELFRVPGRPIGWLDLTVVALLLLVALLAWLGRRWEALDILAKCILVSLAVHFLLMLWFREVTVERQLTEPVERAPSFRVRIAADTQVLAAALERAGQVQAAASQREAAAAPMRAERQELTSAPVLASAREALQAPALEAATAPERALARHTPDSAARDAERASISVRDLPAQDASPRGSEAPSLTLAAATLGASRSLYTAAQAPSRSSAATGADHAITASSATPAALSAPLSASAVEARGAPGPAFAATASPTRSGVAESALSVVLPEPPGLAQASQAEAGSSSQLAAAAGQRNEAPPALDLAQPGRMATPTRGSAGAATNAPGRWRPEAGAALANNAAPSPSALPLAAPLVAASPLPSTSAGSFEHTPYRSRFGDARQVALAEGGGNEQTERAVAAGLAYLASTQGPQGQWGNSDDYDDKYGHVSVGKTGLCLLAFLGAGHTPRSSREHADVARRAQDFLLAVQDQETAHFGYSSSYSHAVATYALSESFALDGDERLRAPLERAVAWILKQQNRDRDPRRRGGWGYYYPDGRVFDRWPRTSVTSWQVMALESARLAGLTVPDSAFDSAHAFLLQNHEPQQGVVLYSRDPERLSSAYPTLPGSTPAGLFALSLLGEELTDSRWGSAFQFILERRPRTYARPSDAAFVQDAAGNLYFWYYASLALFRRGGRDWELWNQSLQTTLLPAQRRDGSWPVISIYARYAGDDDNDRSYTTALNVLTLEVYYRYFTPLLKVK